MHLDGHKIKRGLKVVAASSEPYYKQTFNINKIMLPQSIYLIQFRLWTHCENFES